MAVNKATLDLIKSFEGCKLKAYKDPVGVWTIGYGHTKGVKSGQTITQAQAEAMLLEELEQDYERAVDDLVTVDLNENQRGALVSFTYNVGRENLSRSTLLKYINAEKFSAAADEFRKWNRAKGQVLTGLTRRRAAEKALFLKAVEEKPECG